MLERTILDERKVISPTYRNLREDDYDGRDEVMLQNGIDEAIKVIVSLLTPRIHFTWMIPKRVLSLRGLTDGST